MCDISCVNARRQNEHMYPLRKPTSPPRTAADVIMHTGLVTSLVLASTIALALTIPSPIESVGVTYGATSLRRRQVDSADLCSNSTLADPGDCDFNEPAITGSICRRGSDDFCYQSLDPRRAYYTRLSQSDRDAFWNAAGISGGILKSTMDHWVRARASRGGIDQDANFAAHYVSGWPSEKIVIITEDIAPVERCLREAGITGVDLRSFDSIVG